MSLAGLLAAVAEDPRLRTALDSQPGVSGGERDLVAPAALRPLLSAALASGAAGGPGRFVLAVTATAREAEDLTAALRAFLPPASVATFPGWETLPHERLSPRSDTVGQRIAVLRRLRHPEMGAAGGDESGPATATTGNAPGAAGAVPGLSPGEGDTGEGLPRAQGGHRGGRPPGGGIAG